MRKQRNQLDPTIIIFKNKFLIDIYQKLIKYCCSAVKKLTKIDKIITRNAPYYMYRQH